MEPKAKATVHQPKMERTASGIIVPEGTIERAIKGSQKAVMQPGTPAPQRPRRRDLRAMGNKRITCLKCKTPIKFKNFASHVARLHPEPQEAADPQAHVHP